MENTNEEIMFDCQTPLGFHVRTTYRYWKIIVSIKHPVMSGQEDTVQEVLKSPDQIRRSRTDSNVYLFYKTISDSRWMCAVAKRLNGDGFLITAYPTDAIKEGERIWPE